LRCDDLSSVVKLYTEYNLRQLIVTAQTMPAYLGGLDELQDYGEYGPVGKTSPRSDRSMPSGRERALIGSGVRRWSPVKFLEAIEKALSMKSARGRGGRRWLNKKLRPSLLAKNGSLESATIS
jgi:hypothetical protein